MARDLKRVRLEPDTDILHILEDVHADKVPRLIERGGEALAVVVAPEEYALGAGTPKSRRLREELLSHAGVWQDLNAEHIAPGELRDDGSGLRGVDAYYRHSHRGHRGGDGAPGAAVTPPGYPQ
jgi:hypothetical protein